MFERLLSHSIRKDGDKFGEEKVFDEKVKTIIDENFFCNINSQDDGRDIKEFG